MKKLLQWPEKKLWAEAADSETSRILLGGGGGGVNFLEWMLGFVVIRGKKKVWSGHVQTTPLMHA